MYCMNYLPLDMNYLPFDMLSWNAELCLNVCVICDMLVDR
jgi:hypothetical protein